MIEAYKEHVHLRRSGENFAAQVDERIRNLQEIHRLAEELRRADAKLRGVP